VVGDAGHQVGVHVDLAQVDRRPEHPHGPGWTSAFSSEIPTKSRCSPAGMFVVSAFQ
jgi:hypothetical protein